MPALAKAPLSGSSKRTPDVLGPLMQNLCASSAQAVGDWTKWKLPEDEGKTEASQSAYSCVVQLQCDSVCLLRVTRNGGCSFVVRMKRSHWWSVAQAHGLDNWSSCAFHHTLSRDQGIRLLTGARAFRMKPDSVHHPYALSLICGMGRGGLLSANWSGVLPAPTEPFAGKFELIVLPPSPQVVEQCFCLMGHRATFVQPPPAAAGSDDEDDEVPLSQRVDAEIWGKTHGSVIASAADAEKFREAGQLVSWYNAARTLRALPALNAHFCNSEATLAVLVKGYHAPPPPPRASAPAAAEKEDEEDEDLLAPSDVEPDDDDDDDDGKASTNGSSSRTTAVPTEAKDSDKASKERKGGGKTAKEPKPRASPQKSEKKAAGAKRARATADDDEDIEEEDEVEDDADNSSISQTSDEDSSSADDSESECDSDDGRGRRRRRRAKKRPRRERRSSRKPAPADAPPPQPPAVTGLSVDALKAMCQPCCDQLGRFLLANDGLLSGTRWERLADDKRLLLEATTAEAVVAASLSLARTLMDAHTDPPEEAAVVVSGRERARVRALAAKTAAFAEAALGDVDRAIAESRAHTEHLECLRKRGYDALQAVEGGGFGNKDEGESSV